MEWVHSHNLGSSYMAHNRQRKTHLRSYDLTVEQKCERDYYCQYLTRRINEIIKYAGQQYHVSAFKQSLRLNTKGACFDVILEAMTSFVMMLSSCPERNDCGRAPSARAQPHRVTSVGLSNNSFRYFPSIRSETKIQLHYYKMTTRNNIQQVKQQTCLHICLLHKLSLELLSIY